MRNTTTQNKALFLIEGGMTMPEYTNTMPSPGVSINGSLVKVKVYRQYG